MKKLLIAAVAAGLLGGGSLALADGPSVGVSGYHKVQERGDSSLERKILRARHDERRDHGYHDHRGKGHGKAWGKYKHKHKHRSHRRHGWSYDRHRYYDSGHRRHHHDRDNLYFGIADGDRGVVIWKR